MYRNVRSSGLSFCLRGLPRFRFVSGVTGNPVDVDGLCEAPDADDCGRLSVDSTSTKSFSGELARLI